jgi:hypothetical protein
MKREIVFYILIVSIVLTGCDKKTNYVYSPDRKQCITIITEENYRYIINGKHSSIPEVNYVKYSLDSVDVEYGDEIVGCWKNDGYEWKIATDNAIILENKLDTLRFKFHEKFPVDNDDSPTIVDYSYKGCFDLGFSYKTIRHSKGAIVE